MIVSHIYIQITNQNPESRIHIFKNPAPDSASHNLQKIARIKVTSAQSYIIKGEVHSPQAAKCHAYLVAKCRFTFDFF